MSNHENITFSLSHSTLDKLFAAFHIQPEGVVLFAFRGCLPTKSVSGLVNSVPLTVADIDHVHMRCTLGIWDRRAKTVFAAPGSTVPHKDNVEKAAARKGSMRGRGTNQLEPGFYQDLTKGEHLQGKLNGHQALRQTAYRFYRRSPTGIPYSESSPLFYGNPYDNLHCGWNLEGKEPGFSSAGCLVVAGIPHCPRHKKDSVENQGPWKIFHDLLYGIKQKQFQLLLVSGAAAQEAISSEEKISSGFLLYGSSGEAVKVLQRRLTSLGLNPGPADGHLGSRTYKAWKVKA